jgi:hypothetical protein
VHRRHRRRRGVHAQRERRRGHAAARPLDILRYARRRGFALRLYTNGFLIDDAYADAARGVGLLEVHVSLYSGVAAEHDAVTRVPGSFERTCGASGAARHGVRVVLKTPATSLSRPGRAGVEAIAPSSLRAVTSSRAPTSPRAKTARSTRAPCAPNPEELVRHGLLTPWTPSADEDALRAKKLSRLPLRRRASGLVVLPDGTPAGVHRHPVDPGRPHHGPLAEALGLGARARALRRAHLGRRARVPRLRPAPGLPALPRDGAARGRRLPRAPTLGLRPGPGPLRRRGGGAGGARAHRRTASPGATRRWAPTPSWRPGSSDRTQTCAPPRTRRCGEVRVAARRGSEAPSRRGSSRFGANHPRTFTVVSVRPHAACRRSAGVINPLLTLSF